MIKADLPMVARWLQVPEVSRWWGDPAEQAGLIAEDLSEPRMRQFIVEFEGRPFAYVQAYPNGVWPQAHFLRYPEDAYGLDLFLGEPDMAGAGHGAAFIRALGDMLFEEGAPAVLTDPDVENLRGIRAFERAGFEFQGNAVTAEGERAVLVRWNR